jgi:hypothetical protein
VFWIFVDAWFQIFVIDRNNLRRISPFQHRTTVSRWCWSAFTGSPRIPRIGVEDFLRLLSRRCISLCGGSPQFATRFSVQTVSRMNSHTAMLHRRGALI